MDVIIIETTRVRCHLTKKAIERREVILNTSNLFTLDVHHDRITLSGIRSGRNCFGRIEVKTPTGEMLMAERTIYSDQTAESMIDLDDDSEISFVNRKGLLILIHKNGLGQTEEYLVTKEFQGIEIIAKKYLYDDTLSDRIFPCDWQPKPGFRDDAPEHVVALRDPLENYQIRHNNFFYMGLMEEDKVYEICEPFYDSTPIKLLKLRGSFYKIFQGIK